MAAGRPAVGSAVGAIKSIIVPGKTGFIANGTGEWISALSRIAADKQYNWKLGLAARERAERFYCTENHTGRIIEVLKFAVLNRSAELCGAGAMYAPPVDTGEVFAASRQGSTTPAE